MKILGISTTTHTPNDEHPMPSTSTQTLEIILSLCEKFENVETKFIDANQLHIVQNLSC